LSAGALRALFILFVTCAFSLSTINIYAQDGNTQEESTQDASSQDETTILDSTIARINAAERELSLGEDGTGTTPSATATSVWGIFRLILTLALAAVAIYGLVYLIKRVSRGSKTQDPFLKLLASTPIGTNRSVHIIAVGSKAWLVGAAENGVNLISEIEDNDLINTMLLDESRKNATTSMDAGRFPDFKALLQKLGIKMDNKAPGTEDIRKRSEKLKGL
jgi:flagellar protein FliO/FliZ